MTENTTGTHSEHQVVVVGGGFGGLYCAQALRSTPVKVTLIDRRNFHLFQPLLYQVATGGLSPANIAAPLRTIFNYQNNARVLMAEVTGFDVAGKKVLTKDGAAIPFDTLVVATGSTYHYFGKDEWAPLAPGLKTLEDATEIRRRVLSAFERAEREPDPAVRKRLLTFVVVGGGPTGVEMAGTISELARYTLRHDFRVIDPATARVLLVEGHPHVIPTFHEKLQKKAAEMLATIGVEVWNNCHVEAISPDAVTVCMSTTKEKRQIETQTVVWAAGVKASPLGKFLADAIGGGIEVDRSGRVAVGPDCSIAGHPNLFVLGDLALQKGADGKPLPGLAPVAMQQGRYAADVIRRRVKGESAPGPFHYWDKGTMATIGRSRAVAEAGPFRFSGLLAWLAWLFIHIMYLAQFSNRVLVLLQWIWNYMSRNRSALLITNERPAQGFDQGVKPAAK
ncbi:NAD(P)/FAD-dependent oxidoreductase [Fimbriiglobus ruber]|uniref:NADH dehydrogenase n=1 Tax=Fimbriiglobus ruber TaxID=1908690 RepID=A0A225DH02_9BACT|nr:NAD(P)/FAD-dependent oxidoreductase [Fimbriiglobus ruber]OWK40253.1 NADH dehydrogenase [Fimbriiglobus ruber]